MIAVVVVVVIEVEMAALASYYTISYKSENHTFSQPLQFLH